MPGKEIKGRSKIATYSHGGRIGYKYGKSVDPDRSQTKKHLDERAKKRKEMMNESLKQSVERMERIKEGKKKMHERLVKYK